MPQTFEEDKAKSELVLNQSIDQEDRENVKLIENDTQIDKELIKQALMLGKRRGCCERILCLICCCDTSDIGSHSHLS